jgi:hypothetical protein
MLRADKRSALARPLALRGSHDLRLVAVLSGHGRPRALFQAAAKPGTTS